jgi:dienelactone hydrolase
MPRWRMIWLGIVVLGLILRAIAVFLPEVTLAGRQMKQPYALDDPALRARDADGVTTAKFPAHFAFRARCPGVVVADVTLDVDKNKPGYESQLRVYMPEGRHARGSLGCVLVGKAGGMIVVGSGPIAASDEPEALRYAQAGFAVVAFGQDGGVQPNVNGNLALIKFIASEAGLVNARNALEFVLASMSEVDPKRIYVAGHSSAGTTALLFAEHESRIQACVAFAPVTDVPAYLARLGDAVQIKPSSTEVELCRMACPATHAGKLSCPVLLFHAEGDTTVAVSESRSFANRLQGQGKSMELVTVPGGDHYQSMLTQGIPRAIEWLEDLEHPETAAKRKRNREEAKQAAVAQNMPANPANRAPAGPENRFANWFNAAEILARDLSRLHDVGRLDKSRLLRLESSMMSLSAQTRSVLTATGQVNPKVGVAAGGMALVPEDARQKITAANQAIEDQKKRLGAFSSPELKQSDLVSKLDGCILPGWFIESRAPTAEELSARPATDPNSSIARPRVKRQRDYAEEAKFALRFSKPHDAIQFLRAALLTGEDKSIVEGVKWSPALKRPLTLLQWAYGAELKGFAGAGPANLAPQGAAGQKKDRDTTTDFRLAHQQKSLIGDVGTWLSQGLQNRVEAGSFGGWGQDPHRNSFEHRGITLLDFAPVEGLIESARSQGADVLMALVLTESQSGKSKPATTLVVQVYDVDTGDKLWESKPVSNTKIFAARKQGKDLAADFAGLVLAFIDDEVVLRDVPKLSDEAVSERLEAISSAEKDDALTALIELRYFQLTKRITDTDAQARLAKILGDEDAKRLVSPDEQDRRASIEKLVPKGR